MPTPSGKSSKSQSPETRRDNLIFLLEETFTGAGGLVGIGTFVGIILNVKIPGLNWIGWSGCLLFIASAVLFSMFLVAGILLGWWVWLRLFTKRLALTHEEVFMLANYPFHAPVFSGLALRVAGISKAEEKQLYDALRNRN
jgi:hypothetical protein